MMDETFRENGWLRRCSKSSSILEQPVVTDVKASSGEVFERTTHIHVGKLNVQMTFFSFFSFFFVLFVDLYMQP